MVTADEGVFLGLMLLPFLVVGFTVWLIKYSFLFFMWVFKKLTK
jgi:hypothetical protein